MAYLGPRTWALLPNNLKRLESLEAFESKIKSGYLKTAHAEFVNYIFVKWAFFKFISIGFSFFYLFI